MTDVSHEQCIFTAGKPMYYMEVALGQFSQLGPVAVWKMVPIGRGIGFAMCTLCIIGRN